MSEEKDPGDFDANRELTRFRKPEPNSEKRSEAKP
jgi:hypothetical protein